MITRSVFVSLVVVAAAQANSNATKWTDYVINEVFLDTRSRDDDPITADTVPQQRIITFLDYYDEGVRAYLANDWEACINHLERSLVMYHNYYNAITGCRIKCEIERDRYVPQFQEDFEHRHFFERMVFKTLCMEQCRREEVNEVPRFFIFRHEEKEIFKMRKPYEYLQLCYYRDHEVEKAISATYTALVANPGDDLMKKNILYYAKLQQFDLEKLIDFEDKPFSSYYQNGMDKYEEKQWKDAIELIENALIMWLQEHEKCRSFCEGEFHQGWMPDFVTSVSTRD